MSSLVLAKARAVSKKIKLQFPDTPQGNLMYSIVECAIIDSVRGITSQTDKVERSSAIHYLSRTIPHCEIAGVNSEWVHRVINKAELGFSIPSK